MANLAIALKDEIRRLARKEIKQQMGSTAKAVSRYRREIADLKHRLAVQEKQLKKLGGRATDAGDDVSEEEGDGELSGVRFSARSVKAQRARLGISAADYALLVGVSQLTIYNWERGKSRPRRSQLAALVAVRGLGKREAELRLESLRSAKNGSH